MKIGRTKIPRFGLLAGLLLAGALTVGLAAPALAADHPIVVYGDVELDDADAPVGTSIEIYLDSVLKETTTVTTAGEYGPVQIWANYPADHGKVFTFTVDGFPADSTPAAPEFGWESLEVDLAAWSGETYILTFTFTAAGFFPKHLPDTYTGEVVLADLDLANIPAQVQGVWYYDNLAEERIFWIPGVGGDLLVLEGGLVADYSVLVSGACDWSIPLP